MNNYLTTIIVLLLLSSCCKDIIEVNKYLLTDYEKGYMPYLTNQTIKFNHTNGFEFNLSVKSRQTALKKTRTHHCGDKYSTYEALTVVLTSNTPELYINLEVVPKEFNPYMTVLINNKSRFQLDLTSKPDIDTLTVNGNEFYNVYQADSHLSDTLVIKPKQILYSKEIGIIQITMTDDERFTIDE